jgi:F-type H+-transporting ATPase subunit gamma
MASLKDLRNRIRSVKSTQKITSAMKMVAAAKLRRAQEQAEAARPYAQRLSGMLSRIAAGMGDVGNLPPLLAGTGGDQVHLLIVATADRGLCGGFNSGIARAARLRLRELIAAGKTVKVLCIGRKGRDMLRREFGDRIIDTIEGIGRPRLTFADALAIAKRLTGMFERGEFDVCTIVFARFRSAITQEVTFQQLIPAAPAEAPEAAAAGEGPRAVYEFEPEEEQILADLVPRNLATQIFTALLENNASEQGARMTAMDNATRNAGDMIERLSLLYNRTRQASITKELIEIVSGAEAL